MRASPSVLQRRLSLAQLEYRLARAGSGQTDITVGAVAVGCGYRDDGSNHRVPGWSGGGPLTCVPTAATVCVPDTGCASDALLTDFGELRKDACILQHGA